MKRFTHQYNNRPYYFCIFGDRILTNLIFLGTDGYQVKGSPHINDTICTDIQNYVDQLSLSQKVGSLLFYLTPQYIIANIKDIINSINEHWAANTKEFPDERSCLITNVPDKSFLPLIASHSTNKKLIDCLYLLDDYNINCGLIQNPLLSVEQTIELIKQNSEFGEYLIQEINYKIPPELLCFFLSQDLLNNKVRSKDSFSHSIISYRKDLSEQDIEILMPFLSSKDVLEIISNYQNLPQYIIESTIWNGLNIELYYILKLKYGHQHWIIDKLTYTITGGRHLYEVYN